jgi:hypothetical protein
MERVAAALVAAAERMDPEPRADFLAELRAQGFRTVTAVPDPDPDDG